MVPTIKKELNKKNSLFVGIFKATVLMKWTGSEMDLDPNPWIRGDPYLNWSADPDPGRPKTGIYEEIS